MVPSSQIHVHACVPQLARGAAIPPFDKLRPGDSAQAASRNASGCPDAVCYTLPVRLACVVEETPRLFCVLVMH